MTHCEKESSTLDYSSLHTQSNRPTKLSLKVNIQLRIYNHAVFRGIVRLSRSRCGSTKRCHEGERSALECEYLDWTEL